MKKNQPLPARCREIRDRLRDFAANRLGPTPTGEVQAHLLSCDSCAEAFGELLMDEVESGAVPLLTPPRMPPLELYDAYMRAGSGRFGTFWKSIKDATEAADNSVQQWAKQKLDEIAAALDALTPGEPAPVKVRGAIATGAIRTRGAVSRKPQSPGLSATVLSDEGQSSHARIHFTIDEPARLTTNGRFTLALSTDDTGHDDRVVICTLALPTGVTVSFAGTITRRPGQQSREVRIDEAGVPGAARSIPLEHLSLAVLET
jgi:hypothetical protein